MKTAVLLVNLGTPDSPKTWDVRKYLFQFLNDKRVIDLPWILRKILVNLIIVPFRAPKSAKIYKELWTPEGSPLLIYGEELRDKIQKKFGEDVPVALGMRYQKPSIEHALDELKKHRPERIVVFTLFPQYASASGGSAIEEAMRVLSKWWVIPEISLIGQYWNDKRFINSWLEVGQQFKHEDYDHVLFSYHGLPNRQVDKVYDNDLCEDKPCETEVNHENALCYKATCFGTTRLIAKGLGIPEEKYTVGFQSRLDNKWLEPFSDKLVEQFAKDGIKKLLVFSPAFTADCLETTIEIGDEYLEIFEEHGGEELDLVPSLNAEDTWAEAAFQMIKDRMPTIPELQS